MKITYDELQNAFLFVSAGGGYHSEAYIDKRTVKIYLKADGLDLPEELPEDIDDENRYAVVPGKRELGLEVALVMDFVELEMPADYEEISQIFSKRGAYSKYKMYLERHGMLDKWYKFEDQATERALRAWCADNEIEVV